VDHQFGKLVSQQASQDPTFIAIFNILMAVLLLTTLPIDVYLMRYLCAYLSKKLYRTGQSKTRNFYCTSFIALSNSVFQCSVFFLFKTGEDLCFVRAFHAMMKGKPKNWLDTHVQLKKMPNSSFRAFDPVLRQIVQNLEASVSAPIQFCSFSS